MGSIKPTVALPVISSGLPLTVMRMDLAGGVRVKGPWSHAVEVM